jgi:hypothetical protein
MPTSFRVSAYPTYWLIGRDGRIIARHALRPSDGGTTLATFNAAMAQ